MGSERKKMASESGLNDMLNILFQNLKRNSKKGPRAQPSGSSVQGEETKRQKDQGRAIRCLVWGKLERWA